jgi:NAD-dependent SIR2 family protein deacetylase
MRHGNTNVMLLSEKSVALVAESIKNSRNKGHKTCLLIGAGVSITAGIPSSNGFVQKIKGPAQV